MNRYFTVNRTTNPSINRAIFCVAPLWLLAQKLVDKFKYHKLPVRSLKYILSMCHRFHVKDAKKNFTQNLRGSKKEGVSIVPFTAVLSPKKPEK